MGYVHIPSLYKSQDILLFRECYALEKVHGCLSHVSWRNGALHFSPGAVNAKDFEALFNREVLTAAFVALGHQAVTVYGEAYGGSSQGMSATYGDALMFIAFDVLVGETWCAVPDMDQIARSLGMEVVPWVKVSTDLAALDFERDRPSIVADRRGSGPDKPREGVVLRPLVELTKSNGERVMAKHRTQEFSERATPQNVSPEQLAVLAAADAIAQEWVVPMRLTHVLDKTGAKDVRDTPRVVDAMLEDVYREAKGEIVESKEAAQAIRRRAASLFRERVRSSGR